MILSSMIKTGGHCHPQTGHLQHGIASNLTLNRGTLRTPEDPGGPPLTPEETWGLSYELRGLPEERSRKKVCQGTLRNLFLLAPGVIDPLSRPISKRPLN